MDKKLLIGAILGGLALFIWQTLSWTALNLHASNMKYHPKQDAVLQAISDNLEEGSYFLPSLPPTASSEEYQAHGEKMTGKPWAQVKYHKSYNVNMGMNMGRGLIIDIFAVGLLIWLLLKNINNNFTTTLISCVLVGLISYFTTYYTNSIWFEGNTIPDLIDAVVGWGLVGLVLGWWLNRK